MAQILTNTQMSSFNLISDKKINKSVNKNGTTQNNTDFLDIDPLKFAYYNLENYKQDIITKGLKNTWTEINYYILNYETNNDFLLINNFAELYEIGLALQNKQLKKDSGQYYTPDDVAHVMANWFNQQKGVNVCDVACGTGKLILTYLDIIGEKNAFDLIRKGRLYLYDLDDVALSICKTILLIKYGKELAPYIHTIHCDFLSNEITLPKNSKVISNPPYSLVKDISIEWNKTDITVNTKELYSMFMEKIIKQSKSSVIITPYSFISGTKFYCLRYLMNKYNGFIISFDNVPGTIFCGKKHGVFNSNTSNSVRAAITVVENKDNYHGFRLTPLIRFKNEERKKLLKTDILESYIGETYQLVSKENPMYNKCFKELVDIWTNWKNNGIKKLGDYTSHDGQNIISIPNTCRYFTTASNKLMNRNGQIVLNITDKNVFNYIFCLINSSFAYWYWRLFDGGITYPKKLLFSMPVFYDKLTNEDKIFFDNVATAMINNSKKFIVTKKNLGVQENVKYPRKYRDMINRRLLDILGINIDEKVFDLIHSNMALEVNVQ